MIGWMSRCRLLVTGATALASLLPMRARAQESVPLLDPAIVRAAFIPRINDGTFRGIAAGWRERDSILIAAAGVATVAGATLTADTRFELGEAASVFTAALLANLVARGELSLDDEAQRFMPGTITLPTKNGRAITLGDLAFHRSGLPDLRTDGTGSAPERVARALRGVTLRSDIGSRYAFSQLGLDVLGLALARQTKLPLAAAIRARVLQPLGLSDIALLTAQPRTPSDALGYGTDGRRVSRSSAAQGTWSASVMALSQFLAAASDTGRGPLASTFALMMRTRSLGPEPALPVALGWRVFRLDGRDIYWLDAQDVPGFAAYLALDPSRNRSAAVLSNTARPVDAIAGQLLLGRVPVITPAPTADPTAFMKSRSSSRRPGRR